MKHQLQLLGPKIDGLNENESIFLLLLRSKGKNTESISIVGGVILHWEWTDKTTISLKAKFISKKIPFKKLKEE